jgi:Tfp pilus assembly protein PilX
MMRAHRGQSGLTLVVSLIMLIVLTLLVVSAIRFGNINLKITGNAQTQTEAAAAAQVAVEQQIQSVLNGSAKLSSIAAASSAVSTGGTSYTVSTAKPGCQLTKDVDTQTLNPLSSTDQLCFNGANQTGPTQVLGSGSGVVMPSQACKDQQWELSAGVTDTGAGGSGAKVTVLQGVSLRVSAEISCP